jgi:ABC-type uncharacterized transport system substrate-binding protein
MKSANIIVVQDKVISANEVARIMKEMKDKPDLIQITFENNKIRDYEGLA